jgi:hypothetical protein
MFKGGLPPHGEYGAALLAECNINNILPASVERSVEEPKEDSAPCRGFGTGGYRLLFLACCIGSLPLLV